MDKLKQKLTNMKENAFCFVHLIADYMHKAITGKNVLIPLEKHLKVCSRCAREKESYEKFLQETGGSIFPEESLDLLPAAVDFKKEFARLGRRRKKKPAFKAGQIWSTPGFPNYLAYRYGLYNQDLPYSLDPRFFLIYDYQNKTGVARGFPINLDYFEFASPFDLIIPVEDNDLGLELMVEIWNPLSTHSEFFQDFRGELPDKIMGKIDALVEDFKGSMTQTGLENPLSDTISDQTQGSEYDLRRQFQKTEKSITRYITAPYIEKRELETYKDHYASQKLLETMIVYSVIHLHRHKEFLPVAGDDEENILYLYKKTQLIFNRAFTMNLSINRLEKEYLIQLDIIDNETGEETRGFLVDILEWEGDFPANNEELRTAYLFYKKNKEKIRHIRLWEKGERMSIPLGKNAIFVIYKAGSLERIEFLPLRLSEE